MPEPELVLARPVSGRYFPSMASSTLMTETPEREVASLPAPPLENGDHLSRAEFERRYSAMPHIKKAELIEGVVYMPAPVRYRKHARPHAQLSGWIYHYEIATPGVEIADNATVRLDLDNEPQPDILLRIWPQAGGQTCVTADDYIEGAPELVAEVTSSSASCDVHEKKRAYRGNRVREYLV